MVLLKPDKNIDNVWKSLEFRKNCASPKTQATNALTNTISRASEHKPILENVISLTSGDFEPTSDLIDCEATLGQFLHENIISDAQRQEEDVYGEHRNG